VVDLQLEIQYDMKVILYYALYPWNTMEITFEEIFNKKLNYDEFQSWIHFGSFLVVND